jgi:hypothetical protein
MANHPVRTHRWFQISLKLLLVIVTLICLWLGYHAQAVRERKAMRAWIIEQGGFHDTYVLDGVDPPGYVPPDWYVRKVAKFPRVRLWFGDDAVCYINLIRTEATWEQRQRIARMFPEAWVVPEQPDGFHGRTQNRQN